MDDQKQQMYMQQESTGMLNPLLLWSAEDQNLNEGCARGQNCLLPIIDIVFISSHCALPFSDVQSQRVNEDKNAELWLLAFTYSMQFIKGCHVFCRSIDAFRRLFGATQIAGPHLQPFNLDLIHVPSQGLCIFSPTWWKICITTNSSQHVVFTLSMLHKQYRNIYIIQTIPHSGTIQMYRYNSSSISICVVLLQITPKISEDYTWTDQFTVEKKFTQTVS